MWLLIDDIRNREDADVIARSSQVAMRLLEDNNFEGVIFDNDLGETKEGWEILEWAIYHGVLPDKVEIITSNPSARSRMELALRSEGYKKVGNRWEYEP